MIQKFGSTIVAAPSGFNSPASILITNVDNVGNRGDLMRGITNNYSCFSTDWYAMNTIDGSLLYVLGFDHGDSYFQHAILLDEDKYDDYTWDNPGCFF